MYAQRNTVTRARNPCCHENVTMRSLCYSLRAYVVNNLIKY